MFNGKLTVRKNSSVSTIFIQYQYYIYIFLGLYSYILSIILIYDSDKSFHHTHWYQNIQIITHIYGSIV